MNTHLIFADSNNRDVSIYPTGDSYTLHLTRPLKNIERVDLVSARVPNTMYNLTSNTNCITINDVDLSLNQGFYSAYTLAADISALSSVSLTYLSETGHYIFSYLPSSFTIKINSPQLGMMLGMVTDQTLTSDSAGPTYPLYNGQQILTSTNLIDFSVNDYIFLDIDELRTPSHIDTGAIQSAESATISGSNASRSFAPIIMDIGSACIKNFHENKDYVVSVFYPEPINSLQRLTVRWVDKNGAQINFQGWDTNAFILRAHVREDESRRLLPPPPPLQDVEIKRIIDAMSLAPSPPPVEKRRKVPWFIIVLVALAGFIAYKTFYRPVLSE